ncbi:hypothetical protein Rsub_07493 [Raphidocelis subcapitata]|uniref:Uncharacterized protein n=1 Tax=Raphidocelis subcapitata TaxID=307507 RepID=A0A2V0P7T4_9CHLO|nr:hypothetical protein Rsub_07493 [Raphidocelis subcapitata]|eukprot:GBF94992.1 hypothetical protein Rsub_07493 [Raphidocelis subcapitata]
MTPLAEKWRRRHSSDADVEAPASAPAPEQRMAPGFDAYAPVGSDSEEPRHGAWGGHGGQQPSWTAGGGKKPAAAAARDDDGAAAPPSDQAPARRHAASPAPSTSGGGGIGHSIYAAKEASASAFSVFVLILWTICVIGWTGFQVVQNALWYKDIRGMNLGSVVLADPPQVGSSFEAGSVLEERALWIILGVESGLILCFFSLAISLLWVPYIRSCQGGERSRRTKRSFLPWFCTLLLVCAAWFKLFALVCLMNKMQAHGLWCSTSDYLDLKYTFNPKSMPPLGCTPAWFAPQMRQTLVFALITIGFHMLCYFGHQPLSTTGKVFGAVPVILIVGFLLVKPITSLVNYYYTLKHFNTRHNFTFTAELIVSLISFITAVWLSVYMGWAIHSVRLVPRFTNTLLACCGRKMNDVYGESERAEMEEKARRKGRRVSYSLRAAIKAMVQQFYYMTQLPAVFGFVAPMITFFSLNEMNWWVRADIIAGASMLGVYMVMCMFHRKLLSP